ncbi:hypothetical protein [Lentzea waywayandensis]|uniref:hypothetical protein n=1 Tax=Lentzea waywayandensis TaxID=84724 RepID=UPI0011601F30|nr:hypothetical protein [Lentzea waywayandensis]
MKRIWRELIEGRVDRRQVHGWAATWVETDATISDPMVENSLQHLHGFDLMYSSDASNLVSHGCGERWLVDDDGIADALARWEALCLRYDADPAAFRRAARSEAMRAISAEGNQPGPE